MSAITIAESRTRADRKGIRRILSIKVEANGVILVFERVISGNIL